MKELRFKKGVRFIYEKWSVKFAIKDKLIIVFILIINNTYLYYTSLYKFKS